ncbi:MAG TPA: chemotaxis protein CheW [Terriglobales bacterium]
MAGELQFVGFRVGEQSYALPISTVREIVRPPEITPVPQSPEHVAGVMNLRGRIVPVIDLRKRFRQAIENSPKTRVLVIALDGKLIGLLVDSASEVLKIVSEEIEPSPQLFGEDNERYVTGVAKHLGRLVILLDVNKLLPEPERAEAALA